MAQKPPTGVSLKVRVQPKASRDQVDGYQGDTLHLRVTALPHGGRANAAVVALLAKTLGLAKSQLHIIRGHGSRDKLLMVESLSEQEIDQRLSDLGG